MYTALYRKWRPKTFDDVAGQPHITETLKNELVSGRLSHAYLFIGSRGTGKTSCAKILAKAVNCPHSKGGNPCNECEICRGIDNGSVLDVVEIDAASNNGVDNIRDLREEAYFTPAETKYRVYIIDEVHMLSAGAFNALLKTLEEPPEHVKFILATTEVHKLPATILSRCQRFDFKRISPEDMADRILYIAEHEDFSVTEDAALLIARLADGAMRDALSILDQCAAVSSKITAEVVSEASGTADKSYLYETAKAVYNKDSAKLLSIVADLHEKSCDMERFCAEMIHFFRNIMVAQAVKNFKNLMVCSDEEIGQISEMAESFTRPEVISVISGLQQTYNDIKAGANRRTAVEMAFIKLASPEMDTEKESLLKRIAALEKIVKNGITVQQKQYSVPGDNVPAQESAEAEPEEIPDYIQPEAENETESTVTEKEVKPVSAADAGISRIERWPEVVQDMFRTNPAIAAICAGSSAEKAGNILIIDSPNKALKDFLQIAEYSDAVIKSASEILAEDFIKVVCKGDDIDFVERINDKRDPVSELMHKAMESGIKVNFK